MKQTVADDLYRYSGKPYSLASFLHYFFSHPGFRFVAVMRWCAAISKYNPAGFLLRLYFHHLKVRFGFQIPFACKIEPGLFLGHFGNIVVNQGVVIGRDCNIAQGVTLGYVSRGSRKGCPTIGERVWIGANAVVVGNIRVGNDVLIAPLTLVNSDVPDHAVISGNPATIISYKGSAGYIKRTRGPSPEGVPALDSMP